MTAAKRFLPGIAALILLILTLILPRAAAEGVRQGALIAVRAALPALFPALVLSRILSASDLPCGRWLPLALGLTCGFPVGAVTVSSLVEQGAIDRRAGNRLLICCCNTGPAFLVGFCGVTVLGDARAGWLLYAAECVFALLLFLLFTRPASGERKGSPLPLNRAIPEAALSFLGIAGCILFFSCLASLILALLPPLNEAARCGVGLFLEITGGCFALTSLPFSTAFPLCAAGVGWAGLSVYLQSLVVIRRAGLDPRYYLAGRGLMSLFLFLFAQIIKNLL